MYFFQNVFHGGKVKARPPGAGSSFLPISIGCLVP